MKNLYLLLTPLLVCIVSISYAQWEPDVRLTNDAVDSFTSANNAWCVAATGDTIHVVWISRIMEREIFYKRSLDGGSTWSVDTMLSSGANNSDSPSIAANGQFVHVVWMDSRDGNDEIYYKGSSDAGGTWGFDDRITTNSAESRLPSVAGSGSYVHVVYDDFRDADWEIYYRRSTDAGGFWVTNTRLTNSTGPSNYASVAVSGSTVHVVWEDSRDGNSEIYYKRSADTGLNWGTDTRLTLNSVISSKPSIAVSESDVHVVWFDYRDSTGGPGEIYYKRSTNGGLDWDPDVRLTHTTYPSLYPSAAVSGDTIHLVWFEFNEMLEIFYKRSTDGGSVWEQDVRLTTDSALSYNPSVAASGPAVHVVFWDRRDAGNYEIYYKRNLTGDPTDVDLVDIQYPQNYVLLQNYPNPFNPTTTIRFSIPKAGDVSLKIFNLLGEEVATLTSGHREVGTHTVEWDATKQPSGVYFYRLQAGEFTETRKLVLLR